MCRKVCAISPSWNVLLRAFFIRCSQSSGMFVWLHDCSTLSDWFHLCGNITSLTITFFSWELQRTLDKYTEYVCIVTVLFYFLRYKNLRVNIIVLMVMININLAVAQEALWTYCYGGTMLCFYSCGIRFEFKARFDHWCWCLLRCLQWLRAEVVVASWYGELEILTLYVMRVVVYRRYRL